MTARAAVCLATGAGLDFAPMLPAPAFVISDTHLGVASPEVERALVAFLRSLPGRAGSLLINGDLMESGSAAAVMGNPINAVAWPANKLTEFGVTMEPGDVILSGSFVKAVPFEAGDSIMALFDQLGEVGLMVGA